MRRSRKPAIESTIGDIDGVAAMLEAQHGQHAGDVADFFAAYHGHRGDIGRSWGWAGVAEWVRLRQRLRLTAPSA